MWRKVNQSCIELEEAREYQHESNLSRCLKSFLIKGWR